MTETMRGSLRSVGEGVRIRCFVCNTFREGPAEGVLALEGFIGTGESFVVELCLECHERREQAIKDTFAERAGREPDQISRGAYQDHAQFEWEIPSFEDHIEAVQA